MIQRMVIFLKDVRSELSQVSWPAPRELYESTKVVLITVALLSMVIGVIDFLCAQMMRWILR